jgi:hypothetical protein
MAGLCSSAGGVPMCGIALLAPSENVFDVLTGPQPLKMDGVTTEKHRDSKMEIPDNSFPGTRGMTQRTASLLSIACLLATPLLAQTTIGGGACNSAVPDQRLGYL